MARLPTKDALSAPASLRSGAPIATVDVSGIGRGLQAAGEGLEALGGNIRQSENAVDIARAEAYKTEQLLGLQNAFEQDPDYETFGRRAPLKVREVVQKGAEIIRDPAMRERWAASAMGDAARTADSILDRGRTLKRQAETIAFDEALEANRRVYVDPATDDELRKRARADIEASIEAGLASGLLTPEQAAQRRERFLQEADFSRGQLAVEQNPDVVAGGFEAALLRRESGGRPDVVNKFGFAGLYQFGAPRLAELGLYDPQGGELSGWNSRTGGKAKWSGRFNIPGHPEVRTLDDFLASPGAQRVAFAIHRQKMDEEIAARGLDQYIGQTVGGVTITRDGLHAMMHLGGAAGAEKVLKSGGAVNPADDNGTTVLDYARMGSLDASEMPDWYQRLSPEQRTRLQREAETVRTRKNVALQGSIEVAATNAPVAIQNTGRYDGALPSIEQFVAAYGPQEGIQRYNAFQASVDTAQTAYDMRTMSAAEIRQTVEAARPTSSGPDAALQQEKYQTLTRAAEATLEARRKDPAAYTQQHFPEVARAWNDMETPGSYQAALTATAAAQRHLGIQDMRLLPANLAEAAIEKFNNEELPEMQRIAAVTNTILGTTDPEQRRALFDQLVEAGLPDITEGAIEAAARGDEGAARRLFRAAMVDPSKLPGQSPEKPAVIDEAIQSEIMDVGQIGDVYYGLSDGTAENFVRAQRDQRLINNAIQIRLRSGETLEDAIAEVSKDLYGDVKVATGNNAQILVPADADEDVVLNGLDALMPDVEQALESALAIPESVPAQDGTRAVVDATTRNYIDNVLAEGYFRNAGDDGFVFIDPYTGLAVPGPDGAPMIFKIKPEDVTSVDRGAPGEPVVGRSRSVVGSGRISGEQGIGGGRVVGGGSPVIGGDE